MQEEILKYLDRHYTRQVNNIFDKESGPIWGHILVEKITKIFSIEEDVVLDIVRTWYHSLGPKMDKHVWFEPNLNTLHSAIDPKFNNGFIVTLPEEFNLPGHFVQKISKPKLSVDSYNINGFQDVDLKAITKYIWEPIEITFIDPINPSTSQAIINLIRSNFEVNEINMTINRFDFKLESLSSVGDIIERWLFVDCFIQAIDFGDLDYNNNSITECKLTIHIGNAILEF